MTREEKLARQREYMRRYRAEHPEKAREATRLALERHRQNMTQSDKDRRAEYGRQWRAKRNQIARGTVVSAKCLECGQTFEYAFTYSTRNVCDDERCRYSRKLRQNREAKRRERRFGVQTPRSTDTKGLGPRPMVRREEVFKPLDIQRMTPDEIVRQWGRFV